MENNLIRDGVFYVHPFLQQPIEPPTYVRHSDGTYEKVRTRRSRMIAKTDVTIDTLVYYFRQKFPNSFADDEDDKRTMEYLLRKCKSARPPFNQLDLALFSIDALYAKRGEEDGYFSPNQAIYTIPDGFRRYTDKLDILKEFGLYKGETK